MTAAAMDLGREQRRAAWRLAFVVTVGFLVAELAAWPLAFVVPLLAVQFVAALPGAPTAKQGLMVLLVVAITTLLALFAAELLLGRPTVYVPLLFAFFALGFYLDNFPKAKLIASLLLLSNVAIPILTLKDSAAGIALRGTLLYGALAALLLACLAHSLFPARPRAAPAAAAPAPGAAPSGRGALLAAAILLLPVVLYLNHPDEATLPLAITVMTVLRFAATGLGSRMAAGLLLGNVIGGLAATLAYFVLSLFPFLGALALVLLAASLWFGGRIVVAGARAPIYVIGLIVFITLLGLGLITITDGSGAAFAVRLGGVFVGAIYALGALTLLRPTRSPAIGTTA